MKKQFRTRMVMLILLVLLLIGLVSFAGAKYATTISYTGRITFSASLAEDVILQEHLAVRQPDGSYKLDETVAPVQANTYKLIPGLDIPKDPHIIIKGKTPIKAFLFIEVWSTLDKNAVYFQVDDTKWQATEFAPKRTGATVYLYVDGGTSAKVLDETVGTALTIPILKPLVESKPETIRVSQTLLSQQGEETKVLGFDVYLIEKTSDSATPAQAYAGYSQT